MMRRSARVIVVAGLVGAGLVPLTGSPAGAEGMDEPVCGGPATYIHDIQGSGMSAALTGTHTIEGVVVGDYQGSGQFGGYYVQEEGADADANPATSEGIFVFNTSTPVNLGDEVRVDGTAGESSGLTQLSSVTAAVVCSAGNSVTPTTVGLPVPAVADLERYEGMSISLEQELTVTEVFTLARFGEVALAVDGRLFNPTNVVAPGAPAQAQQDLNDRSRILLDDGSNLQNSDPTFYPQGGLSAGNTLRVGDTTPSLTGVLDQRFSAYRVQPVDPADVQFVHSNPRSAGPAAVGGDVQVAAFNMLNYFNGDGAGAGFPTPRGAHDPDEFTRQRAKIVSAITELDADVVGLMELENDSTATEYGAIEDLVDGLNGVAGAGTYDFVDTGIVGTDAIRVGIIYQPARVTPVGAHAVIASSVDPRFDDTRNRPSLAQTFERGGDRFTVVVNHLKSKGSDCGAGDPDTGDGQGNCNQTRTNAAEALVDWIASDPTGSGDSDALVIGDLNAYAMEDPITAFRDSGYTNTIAEHAGVDAYSYVFQGQSGYLDHALASASLADKVTGVTQWHVNADEPIALDYNKEFKSPGQVLSFYSPDAYRSSDHDPVLVGLMVGKAAQAITFDTVPPVLPTIGVNHDVNATGGGSGNPVTFTVHSSTTNNACRVNETTGLVKFKRVGNCVIAADQVGSADYEAASQALYPAMAVKRAQAIGTDLLPTAGVVGTVVSLNASGGGSASPVTIVSTTPSVCRARGSELLAFFTTGTCTLELNQAGASKYHPAPTVTWHIPVSGTG